MWLLYRILATEDREQAQCKNLKNPNLNVQLWLLNKQNYFIRQGTNRTNTQQTAVQFIKTESISVAKVQTVMSVIKLTQDMLVVFLQPWEDKKKHHLCHVSIGERTWPRNHISDNYLTETQQCYAKIQNLNKAFKSWKVNFVNASKKFNNAEQWKLTHLKSFIVILHLTKWPKKSLRLWSMKCIKQMNFKPFSLRCLKMR